MRVLFVSNFYPPYVLGGWEQNCREIADHLKERGHVCHVLTSRYNVEAETTLEACVTRTLHLQADIHYYRPLDFFLRRPGQERANRRALRNALDTFQPDVVFIWGMWNLSTQVAYWAEQWLLGKVAYAVANYWLVEPDVHEAYWQRRPRRPWIGTLMAPLQWLALRILAQERTMYPLALEHVACVSKYVLRKLAEAGILPHNARVIYNGIDPRAFTIAAERRLQRDGTLHLIYTGGLLTHKGVHTAIEALGLLQQRGEAEGVFLMLVGDGHPDYETYLRQRVTELALDQHVSFRGRIPREEIPDILGAADVFLFTSVWEEPIARSVMEAMAAGLAVIGTGVGGQREMLEDGVNALVFAPEDAEKLADCVMQLKHEPKRRVALAEAGQRMVLERFTLEHMVDEMEAWLREIVG